MKPEIVLPAPTDKAAPLVIDIATNAEAARVGELVRAAGWDVGGIEFVDIHPYWLVAKHAGGIVGCVQIYRGRPSGRLEYLSVNASYPDAGRVAAALVEQGVVTLTQDGARAVTSMVVLGDARPGTLIVNPEARTLH